MVTMRMVEALFCAVQKGSRKRIGKVMSPLSKVVLLCVVSMSGVSDSPMVVLIANQLQGHKSIVFLV